MKSLFKTGDRPSLHSIENRNGDTVVICTYLKYKPKYFTFGFLNKALSYIIRLHASFLLVVIFLILLGICRKTFEPLNFFLRASKICCHLLAEKYSSKLSKSDIQRTRRSVAATKLSEIECKGEVNESYSLVQIPIYTSTNSLIIKLISQSGSHPRHFQGGESCSDLKTRCKSKHHNYMNMPF